MELLQPESPDSGVICRLGAILEMDPVEDAVHVILDGPDGDEELIGNLLITGSWPSASSTSASCRESSAWPAVFVFWDA